MEIPRLELEDPKLAKRVVDLVAPLVITAQKQEKMIEVLERELDLGLQHGLSGQASLERQIKDSLANNACLIFHSFNLEQGKGHVNWLFMFFYVFLMRDKSLKCIHRVRINPDGKYLHSLPPGWVRKCLSLFI